MGLVFKLSELFNNARYGKNAPPIYVSGAEGLSKRPLVNYLWINKVAIADDPSAPDCGIPAGLLDLAVRNANRYANADFKIWVDNKLLNEETLKRLSTFVAVRSKANNITVRDLQSIHGYASHPVFTPPEGTQTRKSKNNVYARADYARILVLEDALKNEPMRRHVFYSDMDCRMLALRQACSIADRYGVVVNDMGRWACTSNGYIGLLAPCENVRRNFERLKMDSAHAAGFSALGYGMFDKFLRRLGICYPDSKRQIAIRVLPKPFTALPAVAASSLPIGNRVGVQHTPHHQ